MNISQKNKIGIVAMFFWLLPLESLAQWSNPATVGSRSELVLLYSYQWVTVGKGYQDLKIICRNITTDKIEFKISYEVHFKNGEVEPVSAGSFIRLNPGESYDPRSLADWGGVYKRYFLTPSGGKKYGGKEKWLQFKKDKNGNLLYSAIYSVMNMKITDFVNLSQKERDEKKQKEEAAKKKEIADNEKKEEYDKKLKKSENTKEIDNKANLKNGKKIDSGSSSDADDFWSGGKEKEITSKGKNDDGDFWSGGEGKKTGSEITGKANISVGIEGMHNTKLGVLQLIHSNGSIIKEWSDKEYHSLEKIDIKGEYFKLYAKKSGSEFLDRNNYTIVDKFGKIQKINGLEDFAYINERAEGGFYLELYTSNILHREKLFNGGTLSFQKSYDSSSEAVSDLQKIITRRKEEIKRNSTAKPGDIIIGYDNKYEVIQKKQITVNSKMQPLISKVFYIIHQY